MSTSAPPRTKTLLFYCFLALVFCLSANAQSRFDSDIRWPLCGNWYLDSLPYDPYTAFTSAIDCPSTRVGAGYADLVQAPFGPRHLGPSLTYDWHRGIDLPTKHSGDTPEVSRRPVYAMSPGRVLQCKKSDPSSSGTIPCTTADSETSCLLNPGGSGCDNFPDIRLLVEHERPGNTSRCFPSGCYYTRYVHLSRVLPAFVHPMGASVTAGQFLGLTGHSETGTFNHLHFEVRSSIQNETDISQREAIDPMTLLPYVGTATAPCADDPIRPCDPSLKVEFALPDTGPGTNPFGTSAIDLTLPDPKVTVKAFVDPDAGGTTTDETDLARIEIRISELQAAPFGGMQLVEVPQGSAVPLTPEGDDYLLDPPYLDHNLLNRQYTLKHEAVLGETLIDYGNGTQEQILIGDFSSGTYTSPFHTLPGFPTTWTSGSSTADFHLTAVADPASTPQKSIGSFNTLWIWPSRYTGAGSEQETFVQFRDLDLGTGSHCIEAFTYDVRGNRSSDPARSGPCAPDAPATATLSDTYVGLAVSWDVVPEAGFYRLWTFDSSTGGPRREYLVREVTSGPVLLGRPKDKVGFAIEACYASALSCRSGASGEGCSIAQCSPIVEATWP